MKNKKNPFTSKFARGSGCFACRNCKRLTRETGAGEQYSRVCYLCYDIGGWDNSFTDRQVGKTVEEVVNTAREVLALIERCESLGGDPAANSDVKAVVTSILSSDEIAKSYLPRSL